VLGDDIDPTIGLRHMEKSECELQKELEQKKRDNRQGKENRKKAT